MRRVVVNTTPLIALSEIGKLNILKDMYGEISIPKAVYDEVKLEPAYSEVNSSPASSGIIQSIRFSI